MRPLAALACPVILAAALSACAGIPAPATPAVTVTAPAPPGVRPRLGRHQAVTRSGAQSQPGHEGHPVREEDRRITATTGAGAFLARLRESYPVTTYLGRWDVATGR
jgi:hypothetical protein